MSRYPVWTPADIETLRDGWGMHGGMPALAAKLGRSVNAIKVRASHLGLGPWLERGEYITFLQLVQTVTGLTTGTGYCWYLDKWTRLGLHISRRRVDNCLFRCVNPQEFWAWAETHKDVLDFSRFEKYALGPEPDWVDVKRRCDARNRLVERKGPWTSEELQLLREMLSCGVTYRQLAGALHRSSSAIRRKIYDLRLPRPKQLPIIRWTDDEYVRLAELITAGVSIDRAAKEMGRSPEAVRGKIEWMRRKGMME